MIWTGCNKTFLNLNLQTGGHCDSLKVLISDICASLIEVLEVNEPFVGSDVFSLFGGGGGESNDGGLALLNGGVESNDVPLGGGNNLGLVQLGGESNGGGESSDIGLPLPGGDGESNDIGLPPLSGGGESNDIGLPPLAGGESNDVGQSQLGGGESNDAGLQPFGGLPPLKWETSEISEPANSWAVGMGCLFSCWVGVGWGWGIWWHRSVSTLADGIKPSPEPIMPTLAYHQ